MKMTFLRMASVVLIASALVAFSGSTVPHPNEETSERLAMSCLTNGPTFKFDGIRSSLKLVAIVKLRTPYSWDFRYRFDCSHSGYGSRSGQNLLPVITPHAAMIRVMRGTVARAIIDDTWDEIEQTFLPAVSVSRSKTPSALLY